MMRSFPKQFSYAVVALAFILNVYSVLACKDYSNYFSLLAEFSLPDNSVYNFHISGSYGYFAVEDHGLAIADISGPDAMEVVGVYDSGWSAECVAVTGQVAVLGVLNGFDIVDVSNPESPTLITSYSPPFPPMGIVAYGNYIYVCGIDQVTHDPTIAIIDISTPLSPELVRTIPGGWGDALVEDDNLYLATGGLTIYSLANPENPEILSTLSASGESYKRLDKEGDMICMIGADGYSGDLRVVNVSNPELPVLGGTSNNQ